VTLLGSHAEADFGPLVLAPWPPLPNRLPGPLPVRHVFKHAAATTQPRRGRTRGAPPLGCYWPSRLATALPCPYLDVRDGRDFLPKVLWL
jgi:hypothetical protein